MGGAMSRRVEARFWEKVSPEPNTGCWLWTASTFRHGYGQFSVGGKNWQAHRLAWVLVHGEIPSGLCVCHRCDNPLCVNVEAHLFLGTPLDNTRDMIAKGRKHDSSGERSAAAVLTERQVAEIRDRRAAGETLKSIASDYGVTFQCVSKVARASRWTHLNADPIVITGYTAGEKNPNARVSRADVDEVRRLRSEGAKTSALSARFGLSYSAIQRIVAGKCWRGE